MAETTAIEWTHRKNPLTGRIEPGATINFWIGCTEVSDECAGCYAKGEDQIRGWTPNGWGKGKPRYKVKGAVAAAKTLDRKARKTGIRLACFTNSLADMFDQEVPEEWRNEAFETMEECSAVDFMVLTKRAQEMHDYIAKRYAGGPPPDNIWLGVSAGRQKHADLRIAILQRTPCSGRRFVSAEPLLEHVDFWPFVAPMGSQARIDLLIVGGESEHRGRPDFMARPMDPEWVRSARTDCWRSGTPFFFKQWGHYAPADALDHNPQAQAMCHLNRVALKMGFPSGYVYALGKHMTGNTLDGRKHTEQPPFLPIPPEDLL